GLSVAGPSGRRNRGEPHSAAEAAALIRPPRGPAGRASGLAVDAVLLVVLGALVAGVVGLAQRWQAPSRPAVEIDLSPSALPLYPLLSLSRGFAAYLLSLAFTLVYGTIAAHDRRAEKVMLPLLDIGQGIPVLGFLPGLVLGMVALFPRTNVALDLACILMIFTAQVWNMTFSYVGSLRSIPEELQEVARLHRFSFWKRFRTVEVSSSVIGLVWNSMMSMAGGWFFLTVNEAFTLGDRDFRLPGIGSYMAVAIEKGDRRAMAWAIVAMTVMIVAVDQLLWRPLVAWSQRFRNAEIEGEEAPESWVLNLVRRSRFVRRLRLRRRRRSPAPPPESLPAPVEPGVGGERLRAGLLVILAVAALVGAALGAWNLVGLLVRVPAAQWLVVAGAVGATSVRTFSALALAAAWTLPIGILIGRSAVWS